MKKIVLALSLAVLASTNLAAATLTSTAFNYRGTLKDGGQNTSGRNDLRLTLLDAQNQKAIASQITLLGVAVQDGEFASEVEFGQDLSNLPAMLLRSEVSVGESEFVALGAPKSYEGLHIGPMTEDFSEAFGLGSSDKSISTVAADGVVLAAIQGLYQAMRDENALLRARLAALERRQTSAQK